MFVIQEIFGHSPRKPEVRTGIAKEQQSKEVNPKLAIKGNDLSPRALTRHDLSSDGIKLPKLSVTDSKECSLMDMSIQSKENSIPPIPLTEMDEHWETANPEKRSCFMMTLSRAILVV